MTFQTVSKDTSAGSTQLENYVVLVDRDWHQRSSDRAEVETESESECKKENNSGDRHEVTSLHL